ncbi:hypothetical protein DPMN_131231 [Dreissena polymorpha]|uniref:Uncharacterized protein n=1 Tax=Dreissena polymorpha TaxID=45954 RepID=A0A9D4K1V6_DREPO|nr:hypothetical protein DPMN_131231 [Dreissena polymorpha]
MSSCADVFIELLSTKNGGCVRCDFQMCAGSSSLAAGVNSRVFWELQQYARSRDVMMTGVEHRAECLSSDDMTVGVNSGAKQSCFWSYSTSLEGVLADSDEDESRRGTLLRKFHMQKLNRISTAETQFIKSKIRVTGLHMEEDFHVCYSTLQKQDVLFQLMSRWQADVFLGAARQELWCTCSQRRRRFKKRNIAEKVNGTCKQDFTCRNGLIAVPTVNKDLICCETTQQKIQVSGVDRKMCLKKEFYYCDSTLQKQGLSCSEGKEEDLKKKITAATQAYNMRCCRDVLTACDRKEIQQLCIDCSHETYIAVTVPHCLLLPETSQVYYQASSDNKAPLWKQHNKKLYCKTSSDSKAPEHATQYKKCQFANLDVDTE